jgi:hypothetical protein
MPYRHLLPEPADNWPARQTDWPLPSAPAQTSSIRRHSRRRSRGQDRTSGRTTGHRWLPGAASLALTAGVLVAVGPLGDSIAHAASPNLFASVSAAGSLINGNGTTGVTHIGNGQYEVTFGQNVTSCAYVADTTAVGTQAAQVFVASGHLSSNGVYVETKNQGGGLVDHIFTLSVDCGTTGEQYAVVGYTDNLVRSSGGVTLTVLSTGRYDLAFPANLKDCAYLSTVGDPGNGIDTGPALVATGLGPNSHTVYVETKNPGGGLADQVPFHLAVVCTKAPDTSIAVVAASGLPVRASALTGTFLSSTGNYVLATGKSSLAAKCAIVATRGSSTRAVPYDPATVEITPGPAPNTVGVQTRSVLLGGGNLEDEDGGVPFPV